jgi:hypothetical protein
MRIYTYTRAHVYIDDPTLFSLVSVSTHFYLFSFWAFWDTYARTHTYILRQEHNVASTRASGCTRVGQQYTHTYLTRSSSDRDDDPSQCLYTDKFMTTQMSSSWLYADEFVDTRLCVQPHDEACWNTYVRIQIVMFRSMRVDHTNCLQVAIKTHSFVKLPSK